LTTSKRSLNTLWAGVSMQEKLDRLGPRHHFADMACEGLCQQGLMAMAIAACDLTFIFAPE
jgi:hypothetical protein